MTDQPEPEDACRPVEIDGETIRVRGAGPFTERDRELAAEIVRAAKRKFDAEPVAARLRQEIAGALRDVPGRWNIRARTDAVMATLDRYLDISDAEAWCKSCRRVWDGKGHQCESDAEQRLARVREAVASFDHRGVLAIGATNLDIPTAGEVLDAVRTALGPAATEATEHTYLSTGCLHGDHAYCQNMTGLNGAKRPGECKKCGAKCICDCHKPAADEPARTTPDNPPTSKDSS